MWMGGDWMAKVGGSAGFGGSAAAGDRENFCKWEEGKNWIVVLYF